MAQADVLTLVTALSNNQADATAIVQFYTEAVDDLASELWLTNATVLAPTENAVELTVPSSVRAVYAMLYDNEVIGRMTLRQLESLDPEWRNAAPGRPTSWTDETESRKTIALYPPPAMTAAAVAGPAPTGADYPPYSALAFHSEGRADVPTYLELHLTFAILAREFYRESDHKDADFAAACEQVASMLKGMVR